MIMCVLLCYPVSIHMSPLLSTGRPISSFSVLLNFSELLLIVAVSFLCWAKSLLPLSLDIALLFSTVVFVKYYLNKVCYIVFSLLSKVQWCFG